MKRSSFRNIEKIYSKRLYWIANPINVFGLTVSYPVFLTAIILFCCTEMVQLLKTIITFTEKFLSITILSIISLNLTTLRIMILSITTVSIISFNFTTLSIMMLSITILSTAGFISNNTTAYQHSA